MIFFPQNLNTEAHIFIKWSELIANGQPSKMLQRLAEPWKAVLLCSYEALFKSENMGTVFKPSVVW